MEIAAVSKPMGSVTTPTAALNNFPSFIYSFPSATSLGDLQLNIASSATILGT